MRCLQSEENSNKKEPGDSDTLREASAEKDAEVK
jgi:hypothetical protein